MDGQEPKTPEELTTIEQLCAQFRADLKARLQQYIDRPATPVLAELRETLEEVLAQWAAEPAGLARYEVLTETKPDGTVCVAVEVHDPRPQPIVMEFTLSKAEDEKP